MRDWPTYYIVPTDLAAQCWVTDRERRLIRASGGSTPFPGDPTKSLLNVSWHDHPDERAAFEALPDVVPLGLPWEPIPADAVPLLASFRDFDAAYAEAFARLNDGNAAAAEAFAAAQASCSAAKAQLSAAAAPTIAIAVQETPISSDDSLARALSKAGRIRW